MGAVGAAGVFASVACCGEGADDDDQRESQNGHRDSLGMVRLGPAQMLRPSAQRSPLKSVGLGFPPCSTCLWQSLVSAVTLHLGTFARSRSRIWQWDVLLRWRRTFSPLFIAAPAVEGGVNVLTE